MIMEIAMKTIIFIATRILATVGLITLAGAAYAGHFTRVPEPSAMSLLALGSAVLIVARVRQRKNKK